MDSIIFDLDGTLWDSSENVAASWNGTLAGFDDFGEQKPLLTAEDLKSGMGLTMTELAKKYFPMLDEKRQLEVLGECMREENKYIAVHGGKLFCREEETLAALSRRYRLFIVSNCQCGYIEAFLAYTGFSRYFEGHMCWGDTHKPKSHTIAALVARYGCKDSVYVGDTQGDCDSAFDAGVKFIHAAYGFGDISTPERVTAYAYSFEELDGIM